MPISNTIFHLGVLKNTQLKENGDGREKNTRLHINKEKSEPLGKPEKSEKKNSAVTMFNLACHFVLLPRLLPFQNPSKILN